MSSKHLRRNLAARTRRRQVIFAVIAVLVIIAIILAYALQGGNGGGPDAGDGEEDEGGTRTLPIAGAGDDAGVSFELLSVTCGWETVSGAGAHYTPAGEYCLAELTMSAERELELDVGCQYLLVAQQKVAAAADPTLFLLQNDTGTLVASPEPVNATLVFDIAKDGDVSGVELHGACDAPGVVLSA